MESEESIADIAGMLEFCNSKELLAVQATGTELTSSDAVRTPKVGDRIHHPEFGAGTLDQLIGDMAFCVFDEVRDSAGYVQRNAKRSPYVRELTPLLGFDDGEEEF